MHRGVIKRATIIVRVPVQARMELERLADKDHRSISSYVRIILDNHLEKMAHERNKR